MRPIRILAFLTLAALPAALPAAAQPAPLAGLDAYVERAMRDWRVPGLAIAIVRDTTVILAKGYGVREAGKPERVDARTVFAIGSASKAFTAATVAMMVDEKKVRWDDAATRHIPGFQLFDPYVTREITVRDLLSHRSGLSRGDLLWYGSELPREEIVRRVRFLRPSWSLRAQFGYQNIMYVAAGEVVRAASGRPWEDVVRERLFEPLGMRESSVSVRDLEGRANVARPHRLVRDTLQVIPYRNIDNVGPAGSINSSVTDMTRWVRMQLDSGRANGRTIVSLGGFLEMRRPHTVIPLDTGARRANPYRHLRSYGLGWFLEDFRGREVVHHGGNIDGMSALVAMMPEERVGIVVLTNMNGSGLPAALMYRVFDQLLGVRPRDWSAEGRADVQRAIARGRQALARTDSSRVANTRPSLALDAYAGAYADSLYGQVRVAHESGALTISAGPAFQGTLEHWHFDTFLVRWSTVPQEGRAFATFAIDRTGKPGQLTLDLEGPITFQRMPPVPAVGAGAR